VNESVTSHSPDRWSKQVEDVCAAKGLQLTPLRRRVLSILSESENPLGAYAIIDRLSKIEGKPIAPPTVYRTLEFFQDHGFLHKVESRNVFTLCTHIGHTHAGILLLCDICGSSQEIEDPDVTKAYMKAAQKAGFHVSHQLVEMHGQCRACASTHHHTASHHEHS
jgi:Fur family transcriptional regulator, zinc uptake regulator